MNKERLKSVMRQFAERPLPEVKPRALVVPTDSGKVVSLIGARRTGKTFLLFQLMQDLMAAGVQREQIIYLNFEDDRLYPVVADELDLILRAHDELFPDVADRKRYVFFDEVQNVDGWERYVRRIYDTEDVSVFLTGSSSALLQKDMSTAMRGRSITFEVFPLSFPEFLSFRDLEYVPHSDRSEARIIAAFSEYLDWGGFPEVVLAEEAMRPLILQEYASLMLHRDLVERYNVRNERLMRLLLRFCAEHTGGLANINKLYKDFTSQGLKIGKATLYEYMSMLEDSFIVFASPKYEASTRRQLQSPHKIHLLDPGLGRMYRARPERDIGHRFESLVYLHERRRHREICYYTNGFELDMCWNDGEAFVNVAWDLGDPNAFDREFRAVEKGQELWPDAEAKLVYGINGEKLKDDPRAIEGWRYLLN